MAGVAMPAAAKLMADNGMAAGSVAGTGKDGRVTKGDVLAAAAAPKAAPAPVAIPYRGHSDRLFKRDFAGEILDRHPQLQLVDYGFAYRRDPNFPQDDITWFLMEKR